LIYLFKETTCTTNNENVVMFILKKFIKKSNKSRIESDILFFSIIFQYNILMYSSFAQTK